MVVFQSFTYSGKSANYTIPRSETQCLCLEPSYEFQSFFHFYDALNRFLGETLDFSRNFAFVDEDDGGHGYHADDQEGQ